MLELKLVDNREAWDEALLSLPAAHVLQSWDWGAFKSRWGWRTERLVWYHLDRPVAAAQVLQRSIPGTPWSLLYTSKGPALDYADSDLVDAVLAELEQYARRRRALFIKIDPDVVRAYGEPDPGQSLTPTGRVMLDRLAQRGWFFSPEQIQFRNTILLDLSPEPKALLAAMKSKWRYNIRLAERRGVAIEAGNESELGLFFRLYAETAQRDEFLIRPEAYYQDVWRSFLQAGRAELLLARVEDEPVAGLLLFLFGRMAWYMYGASTNHQRQLMPNHLLQWQAICRARELGCTRYDMWGAPEQFDESDAMWGVYRFKQGFGGQVVQGLGAFDYPTSRPLYWTFTSALPRARSLWRRLKTPA